MNKRLFYCLVTLILLCPATKAQVLEHFRDGNFKENPAWTGDTSAWLINAAGQLQSADTVKNGSFYLATANNLCYNTCWQLYVDLAFNTSSTNYTDIYLSASTNELSDKNTIGYFIRMGGTKDDICLYRKDSNNILTKLIDGLDGSLNKSNNTVKLKITRDSSWQWTLYRDTTGSGNNYINEGSATDAIYTTGSFFGFFVKQSTASFFRKHFFDDIMIAPIGAAADTTTPVVDSINNGDVIINEVLFNPRPGGVDYVELYNKSNKSVDLKQLAIANRNSEDQISNAVSLSSTDLFLAPDSFIVVTEDPDIVRSQYMSDPAAFLTVKEMPSFNDANGDVIILDALGNVLDELQYDEDWQFALINNPEGVSLERIRYDSPTQSEDNWHSAATSAGYGTPGYKNSQYETNDSLQKTINITPAIFSPDNDGVDDIASIDYTLPQPGYVANITVFDASGRIVRRLVQNGLCGTKGTFSWNGLGEKEQPLPMGVYIIFTELFNLNGNTMQFKNSIALARKQ